MSTPNHTRETCGASGGGCVLPSLAEWRSDMREALTEARSERDQMLDVIARCGRPPWTTERQQRIFDTANEIAKATGYAA